MTISEAGSDLRKLVRDACTKPVRLAGNGGEGAILLSEAEYDRIRGESK